MKVTTFHDLLTLELQDLYSVENQIIEAAPKMEEASTDKELKNAFKSHLKETQNQAKRLEKIAKLLEFNPKGKPCDGMKGIIKEGEEVVKADMEPSIKDAAIIAAAQKVEHYEISGYGTAIAMAKLLKLKDVADLLKETIAEEENSDKTLTKIAQSSINKEAFQAKGE